MAFSKLDLNLLTRVVRRLQGDARVQEERQRGYVGAGDLDRAKETRAEAARLHRDAREVDELRGRLAAAVVGNG